MSPEDEQPQDDSDDLEGFTEAEWKEIERRMTEHDRDPGSAIPWEEVRQRLLNRFG